MSRRARLLRNIAVGFAAIILVLSVAVIAIVQTNWFREYVKRQIVAAAEQGTGGKVEIGSLAFDWKRLRAVVSDLVIHGKEPAGSAPWISVRRIQLEFRIFSLSHLLNLSYLGVERPEAAIMVFPDGSTNIPTPRRAYAPSNTSPLETVVDLAVGRFELTNGVLAFNSRKQALNVRGDNLRAQLWYNILERGYHGQISLEPLYVVSGRNTPVKFALSLPIGLGRDRIDVRGATISTAASRIRIDAAVEDLRNPRISAHISGRVALPDLKNCGNLPLETNAGNLLSALDLDANAAITGEAIQVTRLHLGIGHSNVDASGKLKDSQGNGAMGFTVRLAVGELGRLAKVAARPEGLVLLNGTATLDRNNNYQVAGKIEAREISFQAGATRVSNVSLSSGVRLDPQRLDLPDLRLNAIGGELTANASLEDFARFKLDGNLRHMDLRAAARALGQKGFAYAGVASGPIAADGDLHLPGTQGFNASVRISIAPRQDGIPVTGRLSADYNGAADNIHLGDSYLALPHTRLTLSGSPGHRLDFSLTTRDLGDLLAAAPPGDRPAVALDKGGQAAFTGAVTGSLSSPHIAVHLAANQLSAEGRRFDALALDAAASSAGAAVSNGSLTRGVMQMQFAASVGLQNWRTTPAAPLSSAVSVRNGDLADAMVLAGRQSVGYSGALSATVNVTGTVGNPLGDAYFTVTNGSIQGEPFDAMQATVKMADQLVTIPAFYATAGPARIDLAAEFHHPRTSFGTGHLHARFHTSRINLAQFRTLQNGLPQSSGDVQMQAEVSGDLSHAPAAAGEQAEFLATSVSAEGSAHNLRFGGQSYGDLSATARTNQQVVHYNVTSNFAGSKIGLNGNTELARDYPTTADAAIADLRIERVLTVVKRADIPAKGVLSCSLHFAGTSQKPTGSLDFDLANAALYGEPVDHVRARATYLAGSIEVANFEVVSGPSRVVLDAKYDHPAGDLQAGDLQFQVRSSRIDLARVHNVEKLRPGLAGTLQISASGAATVRQTGTRVLFHNLDAAVAASGIAAQGKQFGDLTLKANTTGGRLNFALDSNLADASIHGHGSTDLSGDYPLNADLTFSNVAWTRIAALLGPVGERPTFEVTVDGQVALNGPAARIDDLSGSLKLTRVNLTADPGPGAARRPVAIQNQGPIGLSLAHGTARIDSFHLTGPETDLQARGSASIDGKQLNLTLNADGNLAVLKQLDRDVVASGNVILAATVRGDVSKPLVNGKLELHDASLSYTEFPNGISHANGVVQFNGNSAAIRNLTGESGGGKLTLAGFVTFRDQLRFGLRANAANVRVRPQQGMSAVFDADINLAGTLQNSTISGLITVGGITYAPQSDIGSILSRSPPDVDSAASPTPLLDNMKLDIRVRTAASMAVRAAMAENLQIDASLQIRGTASQPGMLGRVSISEGQLVFFNSTYTVNTGTISFYNPVRIEPVLNLSLNTQAKGVDVVLNVTGPIDNMKLNYTSDPPLQFDEIVELLATGKTPTSDPTILANQPPDPPQTFTQMGESAVVSKALADPVASRLQRVFGVNQLSVDPVFTSGSDLPQARVTLQQRVSSNMTFTYVTALNAPNTQIVRAEWMLNPQWSAMAMRDQNGILSVRLTYKRQLR